jgi:hypothetical protein
LGLIDKCDAAVSVKHAASALLSLAQHMVAGFNALGVADVSLPEPLVKLRSRMFNFCKALVACLNPQPHYLGCNVKDIHVIAKYDGSFENDLMETTLRDAIKSHKFWKEAYASCQKVSGPAKELAPKIQTLESALQAASTIYCYKIKAATAMLVLSQWGTLQPPNLRPNAVQKLEELLLPLITTIANHISKANSTAIVTDMDMDIDAFVVNLEAFSKSTPRISVAEAVVVVASWRDANQFVLRIRQLSEYVDTAIASETIDIMKLLRLMQMDKTGAYPNQLNDVMWIMLDRSRGEAWTF